MNAPSPVAISPVKDIVADMRAGRMVILVDEEDRENEGDLVLAADHVTPEAINFMARFGRGLICCCPWWPASWPYAASSNRRIGHTGESALAFIGCHVNLASFGCIAFR
jgi:hypothetical protein